MFIAFLFYISYCEILNIDDMDVECVLHQDTVVISSEELRKPAISTNLFYEFSIPETVEYEKVNYTITGIGAYAFYKSKITKIEIPKSISQINSTCFELCRELQTIIISSENEHFIVDEGALYSYDQKILYRLPFESMVSDIDRNVRIYSDSCFSCCTFTRFYFPKNTESVGMGLFSHCEDLKRVGMKNLKISYIPNRFFIGCVKLEYVEFPDDYTSIGDQAFQSTQISSIKIPRNLDYIGVGAFKNTKISQMDLILVHVTNINAKSFMNCDKLRHFKFPDRLEFVDKTAFKGCKHIESIVYRGSQFLNETVFDCYPYAYVTYKYPGKFFCGLVTDEYHENQPLRNVKYVNYHGPRW